MTTTALTHLCRYVRQHNLSLGTLQTLCLLQERGPLKMHDIARELGVTTAAITGLADRLIALSYATRAYGKADRRTIYLKITFHGVVALTAATNPEKERGTGVPPVSSSVTIPV